MKDATHMIGMTIGVSDPDDWSVVWNEVNGIAGAIGKTRPNVSVTSYVIGESEDTEPGEFYNEGTLLKVFTALRKTPMTEKAVMDAIAAMQNAGILFRERRSS